MNPEEVPNALVEKAARALWEADAPAPELGWPHWDVAVERAANGLWDLPQMVADTRMMARHALAAVLPEIQAQVRRAVADEISSDAMSSDFLDDHVSDAGITWFVREIRESAEEIDGRHVHTWSPARGVYGVGERPPLECACGDRATRLITTTDGPTT